MIHRRSTDGRRRQKTRLRGSRHTNPRYPTVSVSVLGPDKGHDRLAARCSVDSFSAFSWFQLCEIGYAGAPQSSDVTLIELESRKRTLDEYKLRCQGLRTENLELRSEKVARESDALQVRCDWLPGPNATLILSYWCGVSRSYHSCGASRSGRMS